MAINTALSDTQMAAEIRLQLEDVKEYMVELTSRGYVVSIVTSPSDNTPTLTIIKTIAL